MSSPRATALGRLGLCYALSGSLSSLRFRRFGTRFGTRFRATVPRVSEQQPPGKVYEKTMGARVSVSGSMEASVARGLNEIRLAVVGILVTVGLAAAAIPDAWTTQLAAGLGSFAFACLLVRWRRSRQYLMSLAHRLTGQ
jgi:hypothetical protein